MSPTILVTIPEDERDHDLQAKLREELTGILRWAIEGCLQWNDMGLSPPTLVQEATKGYRRDMDILGQFLDESCVMTEGVYTRSGDLYERYRQWAANRGERPMTQKSLGQRLQDRGLSPGRISGGTRVWHGIELKEELDQHELETSDA